jgi:c(7)-type cytochrome triheme protein
VTRPPRRPPARCRFRAGALLVAALAWATAAGAQAIEAPADFPMAKGEASPGTVVFSHARHRPRVERCSTCHMKDFKMKRGASGPITLEAKQAGKFCGACHDGTPRPGRATAFPIDECDRCHRD